MNRILSVIVLLILLSGCSNNTVFRDYVTMDDVSWNRHEVLNFDMEVEEGKSYDYYFSLRHHTDFPYSFIEIVVIFKTPNGERRSKQYHYSLKNKDLNWKGDGMGELWDIDLPIRKNMKFSESGMCTITIENKMHRVEIPGIIEVGLVVKESENKDN